MFKVKLRKKLSMTIAGVLTAVVAYIAAMKGIELTPDMQLELTKHFISLVLGVIGLFNVGQGIADMGKENGGGKK